MKFCVSSKILINAIRAALKDKSEFVYIYGDKGYMSFGNPDNLIPLEISPRNKSDVYQGKFHVDQWNSILNFIMQLEEQPIVLNVENYVNTEIHERVIIEISQVSKYFN